MCFQGYFGHGWNQYGVVHEGKMDQDDPWETQNKSRIPISKYSLFDLSTLNL